MAMYDRDYYREHSREQAAREAGRTPYTAEPNVITRYPLWLIALAGYGGFGLCRQIWSILRVLIERS